MFRYLIVTKKALTPFFISFACLFTQTPSHSDTVHGSQSSYSSDNHFSSYCRSIPPNHQHQHQLEPSFTPAEHYPQVWDPWDEFDSRQLQNETVLTENPHVTYHVDNNQSYAPHHHQHTYHVVEPQTPVFEYPYHNENNFTNHASATYMQSSEPINFYQNPPQSNSSYEPILDHNQSAESHSQFHTQLSEIHSNAEHREHTQLSESHNTNACTVADHSQNSHHHSPSQGYSPPHIQPIIGHDPPINPVQDIPQMDKPPPTNKPTPRLPHEYVPTTTVSNEITLQSTEEHQENNVSIVFRIVLFNLTRNFKRHLRSVVLARDIVTDKQKSFFGFAFSASAVYF